MKNKKCLLLGIIGLVSMRLMGTSLYGSDLSDIPQTTGGAIDVEYPFEQLQPETNGIQLDGSFEDWADMPYIGDTPDDNNSEYSISSCQYYVDRDYLYLYVERPKNSGYNTYEIDVTFFNGTAPKQNVWVPWLNEDNQGSWNTELATIIRVELHKVQDRPNGLVSVKGPGIFEKTYTAGDNERKMEFRIPLGPLGLDGGLEDLEFNIKTDVRQDAPKQDWLNGSGPIHIGGGSTLGKYSSFLLGSLLVVVVGAYRKRTLKYKVIGSKLKKYPYF